MSDFFFYPTRDYFFYQTCAPCPFLDFYYLDQQSLFLFALMGISFPLFHFYNLFISFNPFYQDILLTQWAFFHGKAGKNTQNVF